MENIKSELLAKCENIKSVRMHKTNFCPNLVFITVDYLEKKDFPNGIANNSTYLTFLYDTAAQSLELHSQSCVYLSPADKQSEKYKYLVMKHAVDVHVDFGGKKLRKTKVKDESQVIEKISNYANVIIKDLIKYTSGYPYKKGL